MNDFVYDDIPIIQDNIRVHGLAHLLDVIKHPYWPPPFVEQLYRPLSLTLIAAEYAVGNGSPLVFRLVSYVLYIVASIAVLRLADRILLRAAALVAAMLFAAHPVHTEAVALGVNQSELLVAIVGVVMTIRYIDARRAGRLNVYEWMILASLYAAASLCKETGLVLPGMLVASEIILSAERVPRPASTEYLRGYLLLGGVAMGILLLRRAVLGDGTLSVVAAKGVAGLDLGSRMLLMLQIVPQWLRLLVWPARLQADYVANEFYPPGLGIHELAGITILAAFIAVAWMSRRRAPVVCFGMVWCAIALLPVSNILPTGILLAERTLFLPSVGFLIALAGAGQLLVERWPARSVRQAVLAAVVALVAFGVVRSIGRHRVWNTAHLQIVTRPPVS